MAAKKTTKKRSKKGPATSSGRRPGRPPKKGAVIAAILKETPSLSAGEVVAKAKEQRTTVSVQSVYNNAAWKSLHAAGSSRRRLRAPKTASVTTASRSSNGVQADFTRCVKRLGVARARELLDIIAAYENA